MGKIQEIGAVMKKAVTGKPTIADLEAEVSKAEKGVADATMAVTRAQDAVRLAFEDIDETLDETKVPRLRQEVVEAQRWQERAADDVRLHCRRLERAQAASVQVARTEAVTEFERLSQLLWNRAKRIRDHEEELAAELTDFWGVAADLQRVSDKFFHEAKVSAVAAAGADPERRTAAVRLTGQTMLEEYGPLFEKGALTRRVELDMIVFTNGKWPQRIIGGDFHKIVQGPRVDVTVRDNLRMLQQKLIKAGAIPRTPPEAA